MGKIDGMAAMLITALLPIDGTIFGALLSVTLFVAIAYLTGGISQERIDWLVNGVKNRTSQNS